MTRPVESKDINNLPPFLARVLNVLEHRKGTFVPSSTVKEITSTKHAPRRITELRNRGFEIQVQKIGGQNQYLYTGTIKEQILST